MGRTWLVIVAVSMGLGCSKQSQEQPVASSAPPGVAAPGQQTNPAEGKMKLESSVFRHEGAIPKKYTCEGDDVSPPLAWSGAPEGTRSFALVVADPDAPDPAAPKLTWVHWVLYDIPAAAGSLPETASTLPAGTRQGKNNWNRTGYGGPCPPIGRHRYFHHLYALDTELGDLGEPTKAELEKKMKGHILAEATLMGTYAKQGK